MNELFSVLGWDGPAYMKLTNEVRALVPVLSRTGYYSANGSITTQLDAEARDKVDIMHNAEYYLRTNYNDKR